MSSRREGAVQTLESRILLGSRQESESIGEAIAMYDSLLTAGIGSFTDVVFRCRDGNCVSAHRGILSVRSPYFRDLFAASGTAAASKEVSLPDVSSESLTGILRHIYTGKLLTLTESNVVEILELSSRFAVSTLKEHCAAFLVKQLSADNACSYLSMGFRVGLELLSLHAFHFIVEFCSKKVIALYQPISSGDGWVAVRPADDGKTGISSFRFDVEPPKDFERITPELLEMLLKNDSLFSQEVALFLFVIYWANEKVKRESGCDALSLVRPLLGHIRIGTMTRWQLATIVAKAQLFDSSLLVRAHYLLLTGMKPLESETQFRRRLCISTFELDPAHCGEHIAISEDGHKATKSGSSYETVLSNREFDGGIHYWEVEIVHYTQSEDVFIGVADPAFDTRAAAAPVSGNMWSFLCSSGAKCNTARQAYTEPVTTAGSRLGVFLDMTERKIGFFVNDVFKGWAMTGLPAIVVPAVCLYYPETAVRFLFPSRPIAFGDPTPGVAAAAPANPQEEEE